MGSASHVKACVGCKKVSILFYTCVLVLNMRISVCYCVNLLVLLELVPFNVTHSRLLIALPGLLKCQFTGSA